MRKPSSLLFFTKKEEFAETNDFKEWAKCPLYQRYMRTKKQYLRELQDSFKRKQQERNLWQLIAEAMIEAKEPNIQFWIKKLTVFFEKRFYNLPNSNWIEILCGMNDG